MQGMSEKRIFYFASRLYLNLLYVDNHLMKTHQTYDIRELTFIAFLARNSLHERAFRNKHKSAYLSAARNARALEEINDQLLVKRWSTAGFVRPSVYIGISSVMLAGNCQGWLFSISWSATGTSNPSSHQLGRPALPCLAVPPWASRRHSPLMICLGFREHALHKKR